MMPLAEPLQRSAFAKLHSWARFFMLAQAFSVLLLALLFWMLQGRNAAYSAVLGGVTVILPNLYFARRLFAKTGAQARDKILQEFYAGELMKWVLTIGLCVAIFKWMQVAALPFFTAFVIAQMAFFWVPLINKDYPRTLLKKLL